MALDDWEDAVREKILARIALVGPNGSGKTHSALAIATRLAGPEGKVGVIDTENGRTKLFADRFKFKRRDLLDHRPEAFVAAAREAAEFLDWLIIDSLSHEWAAVLAEADRFGDWKDLSPRHKDFTDALVALPCNLIVTMRGKIQYGVEEIEVPGRAKPRQVITRLGVGPIQGKQIEYEFDILAYLDTERMAEFANRCEMLVGQVRPIDDETIDIIGKWLEEGELPQPQRIVTAKDIPAPRSWAAIKEAMDAYSPETWADFRAFMVEADQHLWPPDGASEKAQKDTLFQYAVNVTLGLLDKHDPNTFPPPNRIEFQAHWAKVLPDGTVLEGPEWAMDPDEAAAGREPRTPGGQPPPAASSGEDAGVVPASEPTSTSDGQPAPEPPHPPEASVEAEPASLEQTVTDTPLTDNEQEVLAAVAAEFPAATEVEPNEGDVAAEPGTAEVVPARDTEA